MLTSFLKKEGAGANLIVGENIFIVLNYVK